MNFGLTTEQQQLADLAREILNAAFPTPARNLEGAATSRVGRTLAETGLAGVLVPEALGGSGATLVEAAIVGEAFGSAGAPGALLASTLVSGAALELVRDAEKSIVAEAIVTVGHAPYSSETTSAGRPQVSATLPGAGSRARSF